MCTVTFIPTESDQFVLTSNRDEAPNRETNPPDFYKINDSHMLFPKDAMAGGSWIGLSDKRRLICLLNGGFTSHTRKAAYRLSRGVVVKHLLSCDTILAAIEDYNFENIEPFTIVIVDWCDGLKLYELVWDGERKHFQNLPTAPKIWSSSTLYTEHMKAERQEWFDTYVKNRKALSAASMLEFHTTAGRGNSDYGVVMDRGFVKTTSRTQVEKSEKALSMMYHDLKSDTITDVSFEIPEIINE